MLANIKNDIKSGVNEYNIITYIDVAVGSIINALLRDTLLKSRSSGDKCITVRLGLKFNLISKINAWEYFLKSFQVNPRYLQNSKPCPKLKNPILRGFFEFSARSKTS
jgi:hypothetical protein